jgi:uncharacterized protein
VIDSPLSPELLSKREAALASLREAAPQGRLAVAFSGGVDSTLLLALAVEAVGAERVLAVTAHSASLATDELTQCRQLARDLGVELRLLATRELELEGYRQNASDRCYHCKTELFERIDADLGDDVVAVAYGAIVDDLSDHRPGLQAAREHAVVAPLASAGLGKAEIRTLSRARELPTWDKPAQPCLASRIPYGQRVTSDKLARIDAAEAALRAVGIREGRVRHHGEEPELFARIEVGVADLPRLVEPDARSSLTARLRELGFRYVVLDLEGFRSGRLNEVLSGSGRALPTVHGGGS